MVNTIQRGKKCSKNYSIGSPWGKLYNKDFLFKNNIRFVEGMTKEQDAIFNLYAVQCASWIEVDNEDYIYHYRHNGDSVTNSYNLKVTEQVKMSMEQKEKFITKYYLGDKNFCDALDLYRIAAIDTIVTKNYFHCENKSTKKEKYAGIKKIINEPVYREAIKRTKIKECSNYYKMFLLSLKFNSAYLLEKVYNLKKMKNIKRRNY